MYWITFFIILLLLILFLAALLFIYPVRTAGVFNSEGKTDFHIMMSWLNPFLKGYITRDNERMTLTVTMFGKDILERDLNARKTPSAASKARNYLDYISLAKAIKIIRAKLYASYSFENPAVTGALCGAIDFISQYVNIDELHNNANFAAYDDYFNINAEAEINAGESLLRIWRRRLHLHQQVERHWGTGAHY